MKNSLNECSKSGKDGMLIECIDAMGRMPWFQSFAGCQVASAKKNPSEAECCTGCEAPGTPRPCTLQLSSPGPFLQPSALSCSTWVRGDQGVDNGYINIAQCLYWVYLRWPGGDLGMR